ncbi:MAG: Hsp70 family protein [Lentilitoribacter sp.]
MATLNKPQILGIDFGTSNSAVGYAIDGKPQLIAIEDGQDTLPTSIFFHSSKQELRFGRAANASLINRDEGRYMRALKSVLGTSLMHERRYMWGKVMTFVDVISYFLKEVKTRAETTTGQTFTHALSGRPVFFHSENEEKNQLALEDLTACYHSAGFEHVEFMFEPEAAAIANGGFSDGALTLIVDIGGGTSDYCLFREGSDSIDVIACNGVRIGGTNFDRTLSIDHVMPHLGYQKLIRREWGKETLAAPNHIFHDLATWEKIPSLYAPKSRDLAEDLQKLALEPHPFSRLVTVLEEELGHDIAFAVEHGKIQTNTSGQSQIELQFIEKELQARLSRDQLNASLQQYVDKIASASLATLIDTNISAEQLDKVIFVGGSSLMQNIEHAVAPIFPNAELKYSNAFTAIIDGLAIASGR